MPILTWKSVGNPWINSDWTWSLGDNSPITASTCSSVNVGVDASTLIQPWIIEPWNPYRSVDIEQSKKKLMVELTCKIQGKFFEFKRETSKIKIEIIDVKIKQPNPEIILDIKQLKAIHV